MCMPWELHVCHGNCTLTTGGQVVIFSHSDLYLKFNKSGCVDDVICKAVYIEKMGVIPV